MHQLLAFVKRGFLTWKSYRMAMVLGLANMFISVASFYFVAKLVGFQEDNPLLKPYGGDYLAFLIIGVVFQSFISVSQHSFSRTISSEQRAGTLEYLLMSRTPLYQVLLGSALWSFLMTILNSAIVLTSAIFIFGLRLKANLLVTALVLFLAMVSMAGIGMISAGIIMVTKQGDPVGWFVGLLAGFLSGVYYPVEIFPAFLQKVSLILPTTHALIALRQALINDAPLIQVSSEILVLLAFACLTIPLGLAAFRRGFDRARQEGTLAYY
jgi:ABC-2 type transport system permease protein